MELPDWVVCPLCHGAFTGAAQRDLDTGSELECAACHVRFAVQGGIPILLDDEGKKLFAHEEATDTTDSYQKARHESSVNIQYYDYWCEDLYARLEQARNGKPIRRVVELMCGGAEMARRAKGLPKPIVGIDLSHKLLQMNRAEIVPDVVPVCASATRLPFTDGSIDLFIIQGGLHHVRRFVDKVLLEIARCLSDGGLLLASEPRNDNPLNRAVRRAVYHLHPLPDAEEEDGFTEKQLRDFMQAAGLELKVYDPFAYLGYVLIGNTDMVPLFFGMKPSTLSSFLIGLDAAMAKTPLLRRLGWASQIVSTKSARS
jgi:SAM-dependent methyltransferase